MHIVLWKHLNQADNSSGSINAQLDRWVMFLDQWERALLEDKEVVVAMDANLDFLKWTRSDLPANDGTRALKPLIEYFPMESARWSLSQLACGQVNLSQVLTTFTRTVQTRFQMCMLSTQGGQITS